MEKDWVRVFGSRESFHVELVKGMLEENQIEGVILNRQDSEFLVGEVELYVPQKQAEKALDLIRQTEGPR